MNEKEDFRLLESRAYIQGKQDLADLYDFASQYADLDLGQIKEDEYQRGFAAGELSASDKDLLAQIAALTSTVDALKKNNASLFATLSGLVTWIESDEAKLIKNRERKARLLWSIIYQWR